MGELNNPGLVKHSGVKPSRADVIAYWRLVDLSSANDAIAKDEKGFQNGTYKVIGRLEPKDASDTAPGDFGAPEDSLIVSDKGVMCRSFNGGYVVVPYKPELYTEQFTIEAWLNPQWSPGSNSEHMIFSAGGRYQSLGDAFPRFHGFEVFTNKDDRLDVLFFGDSVSFTSTLPIIPRNHSTHIAITVEKEAGDPFKKRVSLFVNGKVAGIKTVGIYSLPEDASLFIGIQAGPTDAGGTLDKSRPMLSKIQEVVLHNKALSQEEIENHFDINR